MILSILAGMMIGLSGALFLSVNKILGAFLFSIGLLTILHFRLALFTGKAGLLATKQINPIDLIVIWCGNAIGIVIMSFICMFAGLGSTICGPAAAILAVRMSNSWFTNIALGILCGIFMYIAVTAYESKPYVTVMCVAGFILLGTNHCIADMFYFVMGGGSWAGLLALGCTTLGNVIGTNIIPLLMECHRRGQHNILSKTQSRQDNVD